MLAASSRRLTKAVTSNKRAPKIVQTRACASKPLFVPPSLKVRLCVYLRLYSGVLAPQTLTDCVVLANLGIVARYL